MRPIDAITRDIDARASAIRVLNGQLFLVAGMPAGLAAHPAGVRETAWYMLRKGQLARERETLYEELCAALRAGRPGSPLNQGPGGLDGTDRADRGGRP